jgi:hypothetical protein
LLFIGGDDTGAARAAAAIDPANVVSISRQSNETDSL